MSFKLVFKPFGGTFEIEKQQAGGGVGNGGSVQAGTLELPTGLILEMRDSFAVSGSSEVVLNPESEIVLVP
jgi:hypothetical protein